MTTLQLLHPIRVIGIGGGGNNAINRMLQVGISGVDFIAANTDVQALASCESPNSIQLGPRATRGLGAGANPEIGARAALESRAEIEEVCNGAELIFVTAGMGGGTGSGAAPKVANVARAMGAIVVGIVTMPFGFEGAHRRANAEDALAMLRKEVDTLVTVFNDRLLEILDPQHARLDIAFRVADECLRQAIEGITSLIQTPGVINLDFADLKSILREGGLGHFSIGYGNGENAAQEAMRRALASPLIGRDSIEGAKAVVVNFQGGSAMTLYDVNQAMKPLTDLLADDAPIFFGTSSNTADADRVEVTLMAVGLDRVTKKANSRLQVAEILAMGTAHSSLGARHESRARPLREKVEQESHTVIPLQEAEPVPVAEHPWLGYTTVHSAEIDPYPMDDLSIPAFLRRRKRASA
jgi:cell division protein FtsZ